MRAEQFKITGKVVDAENISLSFAVVGRMLYLCVGKYEEIPLGLW